MAARSRDNLPDPRQNEDTYVPDNMPAIGDPFDLFNFGSRRRRLELALAFGSSLGGCCVGFAAISRDCRLTKTLGHVEPVLFLRRETHMVRSIAAASMISMLLAASPLRAQPPTSFVN